MSEQKEVLYKETEVIERTPSIWTTKSDADTLVPPPDNTKELFASFDPSPLRSLIINSKGIKWIRLPKPSSQLEIAVTRADGQLAYKSVRAQRRSDDAILSSAEGKQLVKNKYSIVQGRTPSICPISKSSESDDDKKDDSYLKLATKLTTRTITMTDRRDGKVFTWSFPKWAREPGNSAEDIVLSVRGGCAGADEKMIARLRRDENHRTPGTGKRDAGAGGQLDLDHNIDMYLPEPLVVASCLMMLREELNRRRTTQILIASGGASGGGGGGGS